MITKSRTLDVWESHPHQNNPDLPCRNIATLASKRLNAFKFFKKTAKTVEIVQLITKLSYAERLTIVKLAAAIIQHEVPAPGVAPSKSRQKRYHSPPWWLFLQPCLQYRCRRKPSAKPSCSDVGRRRVKEEFWRQIEPLSVNRQDAHKGQKRTGTTLFIENTSARVSSIYIRLVVP